MVINTNLAPNPSNQVMKDKSMAGEIQESSAMDGVTNYDK